MSMIEPEQEQHDRQEATWREECMRLRVERDALREALIAARLSIQNRAPGLLGIIPEIDRALAAVGDGKPRFIVCRSELTALDRIRLEQAPLFGVVEAEPQPHDWNPEGPQG